MNASVWVLVGLALWPAPAAAQVDPQALLEEIVRTEVLFRRHDFLRGDFDPAKRGFVSFRAADGITKRLHRLTRAAWLRMQRAAKADGVKLWIKSATRTFNQQRWNWNKQWKEKGCPTSGKGQRRCMLKLLELLAMPGTSRHHWGTDIDLCVRGVAGKSCLRPSMWRKSGKLGAAHAWLAVNAARHGFCQPYLGTPESRSGRFARGYQEERWHWSFYPLSHPIFVTYVEQMQFLEPKNGAFRGAQYGSELYKDYVRNIACQVPGSVRKEALRDLEGELSGYLAELNGRDRRRGREAEAGRPRRDRRPPRVRRFRRSPARARRPRRSAVAKTTSRRRAREAPDRRPPRRR